MATEWLINVLGDDNGRETDIIATKDDSGV